MLSFTNIGGRVKLSSGIDHPAADGQTPAGGQRFGRDAEAQFGGIGNRQTGKTIHAGKANPARAGEEWTYSLTAWRNLRLPELARGESLKGFELPGEMKRVPVAEPGGNLLYLERGVAEQLTGVVDANQVQVIAGRAAGLLLEQDAEMGGREVGQAGEVAHPKSLVQVLAHVNDRLGHFLAVSEESGARSSRRISEAKR